MEYKKNATTINDCKQSNELALYSKIGYFMKITYQIATEKFKDTGIFPEQPILLLAISKLGPINQKELASYVKIKPATLSLRLQKLENKGLIQRQNDENDKRIQYVSITQEGKTSLHEGMELLTVVGNDFFECLDDKQLNEIDGIFNLLIEHAKQIRRQNKEVL